PPIQKIFEISESELADLKLAYYSDYFSFVGEDDQGRVAFAIDNNRGRDGETWQADHFVVMHDERRGWFSPKGNGLYPNPDAVLTGIPDSPYFSFKGAPREGLEIRSAVNDLVLKIEPIRENLKREKGLSVFRLGSAAAVLFWEGREIKGRVIHEFLYLPAFNRLSRKYFGVFKDFHGVYATVDGGDLYFHLQKNEVLGALIGLKMGFAVIDGAVFELKDLNLNVKDRTFARGFYRWPTGWEGRVRFQNADHAISLDLQQQNTIANWLIGGFAMGIVTGEIEIDGKKISVYGLGELIL
ncbi:MAG: hypothetical protein ACE5IR_18260, partial [bacterium]